MKAGPRPAAKSLGAIAYDQLKRDIIWCKLAPGEEVSEAKLTALYQLGKAPIRHALAKLVQEGLIIAVPRTGHIIAPVTLQSVKEIFDFRLVIEPEVMMRACGKVDAKRLRDLNARCAKNYIPGDRASEAAFMRANHDFHMEIASRCENTRLATALAQIIDEMTRLLHLGFVMRERPEEMAREHTALIAALVADDKALARKITVAHIETIRNLVMTAILSHSNLNSVNISQLSSA
jgi:DNA-binding GntR family transcriptional regulator